MSNICDQRPIIIAALHLPDFRKGSTPPSMSYVEDYVLSNARVFAENGMPAIYLQDETKTNGTAYPETISIVSALACQVKHEFPSLGLGVITEAHDPYAAISIAFAAKADFVRIKVFVGAMVKSEGIQQGIGVAARQYRDHLGDSNIKLLCDVHDRTGMPLGNVPLSMACEWALQAGADGLILTGHSFDESIQMITENKPLAGSHPVLIGGSVKESNIDRVLACGDGAIVSTSLMYDNEPEGSLLHWDPEKIKRFMDKVHNRK